METRSRQSRENSVEFKRIQDISELTQDCRDCVQMAEDLT